MGPGQIFQCKYPIDVLPSEILQARTADAGGQTEYGYPYQRHHYQVQETL